VRSHLTSLGHSLAERVEPAGGAQLVWIDTENGVLAGASDSRKDGCAIGY
jgi:gamma-glutamyltranspeptidase/glutathione hydrolase